MVSRVLRPLLITFLAFGPQNAAAFVPGQPTTHGYNLPIAQTKHHQHSHNTVTKLFAAVSGDDSDREKLEAAWKASKIHEWNQFPHDFVPSSSFKEWSDAVDKQVFAKEGHAYDEMLESMFSDQLLMDERPLMDYLHEYWSACGHDLDSEVCKQISHVIEPRASRRMQQLRDIFDKRFAEQELIHDEAEDKLSDKHNEMVIYLARMYKDMSEEDINDLVTVETRRMTGELWRLSDQQRKKSVQVVDGLVMEYVQHLGEAAARGEVSGKTEEEIKEALNDWSLKVFECIPNDDDEGLHDWRAQFEELMNSAPFLRNIMMRKRKKKSTDDSEWAAKRMDNDEEGRLDNEWLARNAYE